MYNCLQNYIGIREACEGGTPAASGLYLNDLPGITINMAANVATDEFNKGVDFLQRCINEGAGQCAQDFINQLAREVQFNSVADTLLTGAFYASTQSINGERYTTPEPVYKGLYIEKLPTDENIQVQIEYINIKTNATCTKTVFVEDAEGVTEYTNIQLTAHEITKLHLNYTVRGQWCRVYFDTSGCGLAHTQNSDGHGFCYCVSNSKFIIVRGTEERITGWSQGGSMPGMQAKLTAACSIEPILCSARDALKYALRLKAGIVCMQHILASDRPNPYVRNGRETAERNLLQWAGGIDPQTGYTRKGEYWDALTSVVQQTANWLKNNRSACLTCNSARVVEIIL